MGCEMLRPRLGPAQVVDRCMGHMRSHNDSHVRMLGMAIDIGRPSLLLHMAPHLRQSSLFLRRPRHRGFQALSHLYPCMIYQAPKPDRGGAHMKHERTPWSGPYWVSVYVQIDPRPWLLHEGKRWSEQLSRSVQVSWLRTAPGGSPVGALK